MHDLEVLGVVCSSELLPVLLEEGETLTVHCTFAQCYLIFQPLPAVFISDFRVSYNIPGRTASPHRAVPLMYTGSNLKVGMVENL